MYNPQSLARIRSGIDLADFISRSIELKPKGSELFGLCPFHEEKTPSFSVSPEKGLFYCHGCGEGGDIIAYAQRKLELGFADAVEMLALEAGVDTKPPPSAEDYIYLSADGANHLRVSRYYKAGKKCFAQSHWDGSEWVKGSAGIERILYRLPEVIAAQTVLIVEGEKDCHTARDFGLEARLSAIATTSPGGAGKWVTGAGERWLNGKRVVIIPDQDDAGAKHRDAILKDVPHAVVVNLPSGKDLTDYLTGAGTLKELCRLIDGAGKARSLEAEFESIKTELTKARSKVETLGAQLETCSPEERPRIKERLAIARERLKLLASDRHSARMEMRSKEGGKTSFAKNLEAFLHYFDGRFSYDLLRKQILFDGDLVQMDSTLCFLTENSGYSDWHGGDSEMLKILLHHAKKNSFCPVKTYLDGLEEIEPSWLEEVAKYSLGLTSSVQIAAFVAQLIGSVKRIYEPGCIHRLMPILYSGKQLRGKSTFIKNLYGEDFSGEGRLPSDKDGQMVIQFNWAHEVPECDAMFKTRESSELKDFVSRRADTFRAPYAATVGQHKRRNVMWGTTNLKVFLTDLTGNTRYPVLFVPDDFDIKADWVKDNRDAIWGAALCGYRRGHLNRLPDELALDAEDEAKDFCREDALVVPLQKYLEERAASPDINEVGLDILTIGMHLGFDQAKFSAYDQSRVGDMLRSLGWDNWRPRVGEGRTRVTRWRPKR